MNISYHFLGWQSFAIAFLISWICNQILALIYEWTYEGLSYHKGFVHSLVLCGIVCTSSVLVIGNSIAMGLGLLGAVAFVRFRTNVRDIWDMSFLFAALAIGLSSGSQQYAISILTTFFFGFIAITSRYLNLGQQQQFDGIVRFWLKREQTDISMIEAIFQKHCHRFTLIALREGKQGDVLEYAYQLALRKPHTKAKMIEELGARVGMSGLKFLLNEEHITL